MSITLSEILGPNVSPEFLDAIKPIPFIQVNLTERSGNALQPPQQFKTTCGRRRVFLSARDADQYARGYFDHPVLAEDAPNVGPYMDGYGDREQEVMDAFDYHLDEEDR